MRKNMFAKLLLSCLLLLGPSCAAGGAGSQKEIESAYTGPAYITNLYPVRKDGETEVVVEGSGKIQYTVFKLENPKRLVIDMPDMDSTAYAAPIDLPEGVASRITTRYYPETGNSRIEVYLKESVMYNVTRANDSKIIVELKPFEKEAVSGPDRTIEPGEIEITDIELREVSGLARIIVSYRGEKPRYTLIRKPEINRVVLNVENAKVKRKNEKLLKVEVEDSLVDSVALFQFSTKPPKVKVVANLSEFTSSSVFERDGKIIFDIGSDAILARASKVKEEEEVSVDITEEKEKAAEDYTGKKLTLDFQEAHIRNILRIIADVSGMNIITAESVTGRISMNLKDVPWDLALDIILKNNKLAMVRKGNIIRITTQAELAAEKEAAAADAQTETKAEPLYLKVFQINYESADKLKANLDAIKSARGSIDINERTNTLIVQDMKDRLAEMERLIEILDKRTVQVLIEARIVEVTHNSAKELGIRWGGNYNAQTNLGFPATIGLSGLQSGGALTTSNAGGIVNLGTTGAATGQLGLKLGSVNGTALLDMQLMALQNKGKGRIISMPKITTMNNIEAQIESGREIPYQTVSSDGTKTEFKKATLSLKVTPHVSPDNFIRLVIEANKDEADFANQLPNAPPPIITKRAKTEVLVPDGDTTVIGGLFKENTTTNEASVPYLSKIPFLGWLFKSKADSSDGEELLIFITPKVL